MPFLLPWAWFAFLSLAVQALVIHGLGRLDRDADLLPAFLLTANLLLLPFIVRNFSLWGIRLLAVGFFLNLLVMSLNGGLMPIGSDAVEAVGKHDVSELRLGEYVPGTKNVYLDGADTRAAFLSDTIITPVPRPFTWAVSAGDLVILLGVGVAAAELLARRGNPAGFAPESIPAEGT